MAEQQIPAFTVEDIRLEGLQRVSAGTVFNVLDVGVGDQLTQADVQRTVRNLFESGYFEDVRVGREDNVLVIRLEERPAIDSIEITGNSLIETEQLLQGMATQGLQEGEIFRRATLERVGMELERQYAAQGRYNAALSTETEELPRNRVAVQIEINEGEASSIQHINIVGNEAFPESELLGLMELKHPSWLSWLRGDDKYSRERFAGDLERIESFYRDRGFVEFEVESTEVSLTPDRSQVYITININEGEAFEVGEIELAGEFKDLNPDGLRPLLLVEPGETFSQSRVTRSEERLTQVMGNAGYTFASARGIPEVRDDGTVDLRFFVEAGQRAYVRRIEFQGNTVTHDEVLRREMRQMEGGWASTSAIELSQRRLERLGYFHEVDVETPEVPGTENQIDVLFSVEEAPSGSISATAGFAQGQGLILGANYQENNVLGTGNQVGLGINWSRFEQSVRFNYMNPYFTQEGISRGFNGFFRKTDFSEQNLADFSTESFGGGMTFGMPLSEVQRLNFGLSFEQTDIARFQGQAPEIAEFLDREGRRHLNYSLNADWSSTTLNRAVFPTRGARQSVSAQVTMPGSDINFFKVGYNGEYYQPLSQQFALRLHSRVRFADSFGDTQRLPFFEHFFAGGFGSVRGFERNTLGPRTSPIVVEEELPDGTVQERVLGRPEGRPIGGNLLAQGGVELIFPVPFMEDSRSVRPVLFFDAGNVFNTNCPEQSRNCLEAELGEIRYSAGLALNWLTAMGPMSFSLAKPFNVGPNDEREQFQFELGTTF